MSLLFTLVGLALVVVALRDVFQELFRPSGGGVLGLWLMRVVWKAFGLAGARRVGLGTAATLAAVDLVYAPRHRISRVYLLDAALECAWVLAWLRTYRSP